MWKCEVPAEGCHTDDACAYYSGENEEGYALDCEMCEGESCITIDQNGFAHSKMKASGLCSSTLNNICNLDFGKCINPLKDQYLTVWDQNESASLSV